MRSCLGVKFRFIVHTSEAAGSRRRFTQIPTGPTTNTALTTSTNQLQRGSTSCRVCRVVDSAASVRRLEFHDPIRTAGRVGAADLTTGLPTAVDTEPREDRAELVQSPNSQTPRREEPRALFAIRVRVTCLGRGSSADLIPNQLQRFVRETRTRAGELDPTKTGGSVPPRTVVRDEIPTGTESKDRREGGFHRALFVGWRQLNRSNFFLFVWYKVSDRTPCVKCCASDWREYRVIGLTQCRICAY